MAKKKKPSLPERPGKKSGKRGIGPPLDPAEDFDKPVTRQTPMGPAQGSLLADNPPAPSVANGRMRVFYDKPFFTKKAERVLLALQFSVPLERAHDPLLPKLVADAHRDVLKKGRVRINLNGLPAQQATLYLSADHERPHAVLDVCKMINVNIALVQRKGEGTARKVARLAFRLQVERSEKLAEFAETNINNDFWLELKESQQELWDEE